MTQEQLDNIHTHFNITYICLLIPMVIIYLALYTQIEKININSKIDLPEEHKAITINDTLRGYWKNDTLHIEFNNKRNQ